MKTTLELCVERLSAIAQANNIHFDVSVGIAINDLPGGISYQLKAVWAGETVLRASSRELSEVGEIAERRIAKLVKEFKLKDPNPNARLDDEDPLVPFRALAAGIPDNWPSDSVLTFDADERGSVSLNTLNAGVKGAPTVGDWRKLL